MKKITFTSSHRKEEIKYEKKTTSVISCILIFPAYMPDACLRLH